MTRNAIREPITPRSPTADEVRAAVGGILSNPNFQASDRRRAFLRFIVEETLSGRADRLKGYTIAVAVFGRDETFDSQLDPVVRLEARRLRSDLDGYYANAGSSEALRISIPIGSYVPSFDWREPMWLPGGESAPRSPEHLDHQGASGVGESPAAARPRRKALRTILAGAALAMVAALAGVGWVYSFRMDLAVSGGKAVEPAVVVMPFEALSPGDDSRYLASGISQELISDLFKFPGLRLYMSPVGAGTSAAELGRNLGVAYVVSGTVRADAAEVRVASQVFDAKTGEVLWTGTYARPWSPQALINLQSELAGEIAAIVAQPYGVVKSDVNVRMAWPAVSNMQSYLCVLRAYDFRRTFPREELLLVRQCLEDAVRRDPNYSDAWAMLGWLHLDAGRMGYTGDDNRQEEYRQALEAASRALALAPNNTLALKALGAVNHFIGRYDDSERFTRQALALNPHDPETMAQLGWRLAVRGRFEEGIPILERAIARTVNPPGWYYHLVAIELYLKGDYERMRVVAERSATDRSGFGQALLAIAAGALGNRNEARQALEKMSEFKLLAQDPAAFMRRHGATEDIVDALMGGLQKAQQITSRQQSGP